MNPKAIVLLAPGFEETEAVTVIDILRRGGAQTIVAGINDIRVTGNHSITIIADQTIAQVSGEFDAVILPGGMPGTANLAASAAVIALLKKTHCAGKVIGAICAAPALVLAPNGILDGKNATCFLGMENNFPAGTKFRTEPVVIDGNVITSRAAGTALPFALALVEKLNGKSAADKVRQAMQIN